MNEGSLVRWLGFVPGRKPLKDLTGIITKSHYIGGLERYDVLWNDGTIGERLYPQTIILINSS